MSLLLDQLHLNVFFLPEMDTSGFELDVDTAEFILSTAHQKEDLIDR